MFVLSPDVFDLSLSDSCLQENEDTTTENGINPELAKVGYAETFILSLFLNDDITLLLLHHSDHYHI